MAGEGGLGGWGGDGSACVSDCQGSDMRVVLGNTARCRERRVHMVGPHGA